MNVVTNQSTRIVRYMDSFDGIRVSFETTVPVEDHVARNILVSKAQRIRAAINRKIANGNASPFRRHSGAFGVGRIRA